MAGTLRWFVAVVALLLCLSPALAQPLLGPSQDPVAGSRVFGQKGCSRCHAVDGVGGKVGPDLGRLPGPRSFYDLAAAMWNHLPRMAERMRQLGVPRPHLSPREIGDLTAFLFAHNYFDAPGDARVGRRLFTEKRCIVCHQIAGTGGVVGPNLDFIGQYATPIFIAKAMWNHGPAMAEAMRARGIKRPTFEGSELRDLLAYLKSASPGPGEVSLHVVPGRVEDGRRLFVEKGCIRCHRVAGQGGDVGPELGAQRVPRSLIEFAAAMWNKAPAMIEAMRARGLEAPPLRVEDMTDLVAYLYSLQYFAVSGDALRGREVAQAKGCLDCHSIQGKGGRGASDLARVQGLDSSAAVVSALWNHTLATVPPAGRQKRIWPELSAEEMADLVRFLQALAPSR